MGTIAFMPHLLSTIARQVEADWPQGCCGVLVGRELVDPPGTWRLVVRAEAVVSGPAGYLAIPAEALAKIIRQATEAGHTLVGFYHAHPADVPRPEVEDVQPAATGCSYVIVAVHEGRVVDTISWRLEEGKGTFCEERIVESPMPSLIEGIGEV